MAKMIKRYKIDYDLKAGVYVEVDHSVATDEKLAEINDFWDGAAYREKQEGWPKMDGSSGIKVLRVDAFEFSESDMAISET